MSVPCPGKGWEPNPGRQPEHTRGKRIAVVLANGEEAKPEGTPTAPPGWGADKSRWSRTRSPFDIEWFRVL